MCWRATISPETNIALDLAQGPKGRDFPMNKKELVEHARDAGAADKIIQVIQEMPKRQYQSMADVEQAEFCLSSHPVRLPDFLPLIAPASPIGQPLAKPKNAPLRLERDDLRRNQYRATQVFV
jgi:hypothetical protein